MQKTIQLELLSMVSKPNHINRRDFFKSLGLLVAAHSFDAASWKPDGIGLKD